MFFTKTPKYVFLTVQNVFYTTPSSIPSDRKLSGSLTVVANTQYSIKMEIIRSDLNSATEYVESIKMNGVNFGSCNPTGPDSESTNDCTWYDCSSILSPTSITPTSTTITVELTYTSDSDYIRCYCDRTASSSSASCSETSGADAIYAAVRVTLTSLNGEIN